MYKFFQVYESPHNVEWVGGIICDHFFIFCPICMKFSHNILNTYSFISGIIKHNWKIRRFWVADPLKVMHVRLMYVKNITRRTYIKSFYLNFICVTQLFFICFQSFEIPILFNLITYETILRITCYLRM